MKKTGSLFMTFVMLIVSLMSGCGSSKQEESVEEGIIRVLFASPVVDDEVAREYAAAIAERSELVEKIEVQTLSFGSSSSDPTMYMTAMMKLTGMVAGKEIDVIFYDKEEAARDARSETFYWMSDLFTEEELKRMEGRLIRYHQVDEEGNETEEMTPECGLDLSGDAELAKALNTQEMGIYVVGNAQNLDAVKDLILSYTE